MADGDRDTDRERARLEGIAWGAGSSPAEAARARIALADLGRRASTQSRKTAAPAAPQSAASGPATVASSTEQPSLAAAQPAVPDRTAVPDRSVGPDHGQEARPASGGQPTVGGDQGLPSGAPPVSTGARIRDRVLRIMRSARARPWLAGGAAAAIVIAFGAGVAVRTVYPAVPASPSVTPTPGTITLEQLLDAPQTYADQIPGSVEAPVKLHSTRLVFTNRSLSGDDAATPWNVWAGVGNEPSTICLVATANRIEATSACYPRADALHGKVSLTAQSLSGTLVVELNGGGVDGRVAKAF
ncbi:hypothetical protein [Curtobacterium sp. MCBA15_001]|uniref:hypothetical protein n=1 Tax=Curtobacterium sp. MCBA15_001 TaxID=1898731 RepID=UPI0008DC8AE6|nr:hypothetical protein [Curtobacterium sp. MCBA15_001]OIH93668.1 hypothetical protein BIU90_08405 [Curtobacterium sp. MCBA15_001]